MEQQSQKNDNQQMLIITAPCWSCENEIKIALVGNEEGRLDYGPEDFSEHEKKLAEDHGVFLKLVNSKTADEIYLANTCKNCNQFVGKWFFFAHYFTPALYGHYKYKIISIGK